jgi:WD40 repeat protein
MRLWDIHTRRQLGVLNGHREKVFRVESLNGGKTLVSADKYGALLLWDPAVIRQRRERVSLPERAIAWAFDDDGRSVLAMNERGTVARWRPPDFQTKTLLLETGGRPYSACLSPDGRLIATGATNGSVSVWDLSSRRLLREFPAHAESARVLASSEDGRHLHTRGTSDGMSRLWEATSGRMVASWNTDGGWDFISPDGMRAMSLGKDGSITLREWATRRETQGVWREPDVIYHAGFSPDSALFTVAAEPGPLRIFDAATLKEVARIRGHFSFSAGFSADGTRFATGGMGREALKVFDTATRLSLVTLEGDGSLFVPTRFSPDGNVIASSTSAGGFELQSGGMVQFWPAPSWAEIAAEERVRATPGESDRR